MIMSVISWGTVGVVPSLVAAVIEDLSVNLLQPLRLYNKNHIYAHPLFNNIMKRWVWIVFAGGRAIHRTVQPCSD